MLDPDNISHNFVMDRSLEYSLSTAGSGRHTGRRKGRWMVGNSLCDYLRFLYRSADLTFFPVRGQLWRRRQLDAATEFTWEDRVCWVDTKIRTPHKMVSSVAFAQPAKGTFGNLGADTLSAPGSEVVTLSLFKTTAITEKVKLQFRFEAFNALNHVNFLAPSSLSINSSTFGQITTADVPREIQLALKLLF